MVARQPYWGLKFEVDRVDERRQWSIRGGEACLFTETKHWIVGSIAAFPTAICIIPLCTCCVSLEAKSVSLRVLIRTKSVL